MNHEIDLKKYDIHTDLVLDTIENSSLSIKSDTYNIDDIKVTKVNVDEETSKILNIIALVVVEVAIPINFMIFMIKNSSVHVHL